jgi:hypothetical protein
VEDRRSLGLFAVVTLCLQFAKDFNEYWKQTYKDYQTDDWQQVRINRAFESLTK